MGTVGKPTVAISMGDPWGIGPEVLAVALADPRVKRALSPLVFGDRALLNRAAQLRRVVLPASLRLVEPTRPVRMVRFGRPPRDGGAFAIQYLEAAVSAAKLGFAAALCTAPIHKHQMARSGFGYSGHTDFLAARFAAPRVVMLLCGPHLRVALATVHVPFADVPRLLTTVSLHATLRVLHDALRRDFGVAHPRIAVLGLNPHAGEGGLLGNEEKRVIAPAMARARREGMLLDGPLPADTAFARAVRGARWDALLAMNHDQGLGPLKLLDFERAVNVTLGLPLPRTSPDHGVAYDIAGRGIANPTSMIEALLLAAQLAKTRGRVK